MEKYNNLVVLINYVLRFFSEHNVFVNQILQTKQHIITHYNQTMINYKDYFKYKNDILKDVRTGITVDPDINPDIDRVVAQTYDRPNEESEEEIRRIRTMITRYRRRRNMIIDHETEIEEGIISY